MLEFNIDGHSFLLEVDRKSLVGKTRAQSVARYNKRMGYRPSRNHGIDPDRLLNDDFLACHVTVGDYECVVAFEGLLWTLLEVLEKQPRANVTLQSVIRAVYRAIDNTDLFLNCTCDDWKYRFAYVATKNNYKFGAPETRPSKVTNPDNSIGSVCKHLASLLSNKRWLIKLSSVVNDFVKANEQEIRDIYGLEPHELYITKRQKMGDVDVEDDLDLDEFDGDELELDVEDDLDLDEFDGDELELDVEE